MRVRTCLYILIMPILYLYTTIDVRALYEKALQVIPVAQSRGIWDQFLAFELRVASSNSSRGKSNLSAVLKIEERKTNAFPEDPDLSRIGLLRIAHRYEYRTLRSTSKEDSIFYNMYTSSSDKTRQESFRTLGPGGVGEGSKKKKQLSAREASIPEFLREFASMLPLGDSWNGPIADVEHVYQALVFAEFPLKEEILAREKQQPSVYSNLPKGMSVSKKDSTAANVSVMSNKRPAVDVFRSRQQLKLAKH